MILTQRVDVTCRRQSILTLKSTWRFKFNKKNSFLTWRGENNIQPVEHPFFFLWGPEEESNTNWEERKQRSRCRWEDITDRMWAGKESVLHLPVGWSLFSQVSNALVGNAGVNLPDVKRESDVNKRERRFHLGFLCRLTLSGSPRGNFNLFRASSTTVSGLIRCCAGVWCLDLNVEVRRLTDVWLRGLVCCQRVSWLLWLSIQTADLAVIRLAGLTWSRALGFSQALGFLWSADIDAVGIIFCDSVRLDASWRCVINCVISCVGSVCALRRLWCVFSTVQGVAASQERLP